VLSLTPVFRGDRDQNGGMLPDKWDMPVSECANLVVKTIVHQDVHHTHYIHLLMVPLAHHHTHFRHICLKLMIVGCH
jgi:hypothetical protein